jgi:phage-related protein
MADKLHGKARAVEWVGGSLDDLRDMPVAVRRSFGFTLGALQLHHVPVGDIRKLLGYDGVFEIRKTAGDTYRLVYCAVFDDMIYVLHAFKKKSHEGSKVPREELNLVRARLQEAHRRHNLDDR